MPLSEFLPEPFFPPFVFFSVVTRASLSRWSRRLGPGGPGEMSLVKSAVHKFSAVASVLRIQLVNVMPAGRFVLYISVHLLLIARSIRETWAGTM